MVKDIQKGRVGPQEVAAAAARARPSHEAAAAAAAGASGGEAAGGAEAPSLQHDWLLADQRVQQAASSGEVKVLSVDDDPVNQMVIQVGAAVLGAAAAKHWGAMRLWPAAFHLLP